MAVPKGYHIIVIDLQDCFFTIPLAKLDRWHFAFSLPSPNLQRPYQRFQWKVLPQGMKNSPTLCQKFVDQALINCRQKYPDCYMIHYMDDILIAHSQSHLLQIILQDLIKDLQRWGLIVAPEKIQQEPPYNYLGRTIKTDCVSSQKLQIRKDKLLTLNDFQKLLGDINWIRPYLKLSTNDLKPLFEILKGDSDPNSSRILTKEGEQALQVVETAIQKHYLQQVNYNLPWVFIVLKMKHTPTGCLWQNDPLEWIHLPVSGKKILMSYPTMVASLVLKARFRSKELFACEMHEIIIPYTREQFDQLLQIDDQWAIAFLNFTGKISFHLPNNPLLHFLLQTEIIFPKWCSSTPINNAMLIFTDGSSNGKAVTIINSQPTVQWTQETSAQRAELEAVIYAFKTVAQPFNLYTDSLYIVKLFPTIETATLSFSSKIIHRLQELQYLIHNRTSHFFIGHIRGHSGLPGPLAQGNTHADHLTKNFILTAIEEAIISHKNHHQNSSALQKQFHISREEARTIVKNCHVCPKFIPSPQMGVNPRGLLPNVLWQMDVTHISEFGKLSYVHVTVDTFSHVIVASARTGEAYKDVIQHLFLCFSVLGMPKKLKTDNAPAYTSKPFKDFCSRFNISHSTGIPYNPQGQAIVERSHQRLKIQINKLKEGELKYSSPHHILQHALFVLNHLNTDKEGNTAMMRHWESKRSKQSLVKWKDLLSGKWRGPDVLLTSGRGYACVFPQDAETPLWIPDRLIHHYNEPYSK